MTPYEQIKIAAASLGNGKSERMLCPWCHGGRSKEKSFVVSRLGNQVKYVCFRATCGNPSSGVLGFSSKGLVSGTAYKKKPAAREYSHATSILTTKNRVFLFEKYELTPRMCDEYRLKQQEDGKIVVPLFNENGVQQGNEVKKGMVDEPGPKSIVYHGESSDGMAWYEGKPTYDLPEVNANYLLEDWYAKSIVLVEDVFSAMKANAFMNSVALLGTSINKEQAHKIGLRDYERVYLALDADASAKALNIAKRLRGILPQMRVMLLTNDIKNMEWDAIAHLFAVHHRRV